MALVEFPIVDVFVQDFLYESWEVDVFFFHEFGLFLRDGDVLSYHNSVYDVYFKYFLLVFPEKIRSPAIIDTIWNWKSF